MLPESIQATIDHIFRMNERIERIRTARNQAAEQVLHRIVQEWKAGGLTEEQLLAVREQLPGIGGNWPEIWRQAGLPAKETLKRIITQRPNGPGGSWRGSGSTASPANPMPMIGWSVVYVLYDDRNEPCYVGSTQMFSTRLKAHIRDGKPVAYWVAFRCPSRDAAYQLEDRLLREHKPYLNYTARVWQAQKVSPPAMTL